MFEHNFHPRTSPQHHSRTQKLPSTVYHNSIRSVHFRRWKKWNPPIHPSIQPSICPLLIVIRWWISLKGDWAPGSQSCHMVFLAYHRASPSKPKIQQWGTPNLKDAGRCFLWSKPSQNPRNGSFIWRFAIVFVGRFAMRKPSDWNTGLDWYWSLTGWIDNQTSIWTMFGHNFQPRTSTKTSETDPQTSFFSPRCWLDHQWRCEGPGDVLPKRWFFESLPSWN